MKFDNLAGSSGIGTNIYKLELGYEGPKAPYDEEIIQHTFINGGIGLVDLGTRQEKFAEFHVILLDKDEVLALESFLKDNIGNRIKVTEDFDDERIFMENFSTTDVPYYATILEIGNYAEDTFSEKRGTFQLRVKLGQPVHNQGDVFNPANTGNLNVLIEVNTAQYEFISNDVTTPAVEDSFKGARWYNTTSNDIHEFSGANIIVNPAVALTYSPTQSGNSSLFATATPGFFDSYEFTEGDTIELAQSPQGVFNAGIYKIIGTGEYLGEKVLVLADNNGSSVLVDDVFNVPAWDKVLYTAPADIPEVNFINGVFYWAAFFDMTDANYPSLNFEEDYLAGFINNKSIKIPGSSVDINKGPSLMRREGFSFSVKNNDKFWEKIVSGGVPLFGAKVTLKIFRNINGALTLTKRMTGKNITNSFSYTDYTFQLEPFLLNLNQTLPPARISQNTEQYRDVRKDVEGKAPYLTYGQFDIAALQDVSKIREDTLVDSWQAPYNMDSPSTSIPFPTTQITGSINPLDGTIVYVNNLSEATLATDAAGYRFTPEQINNINANGGFTLKINFDSQVVQDNLEQVRNIVSIAVVGDFYVLTLSAAFPELPNPSGPTPPGSPDVIRFVITNATYELQFNEDNSGGFGALNAVNEFNENRLKLFYLSDNNKDLIEIPANEFTIQQPAKNAIRLSLIAANTPSLATNFLRIGSETLNPFPREGMITPIEWTVPNRNDFQEADGSALSPPGFFGGGYETTAVKPFSTLIPFDAADTTGMSLYSFTARVASDVDRVRYWFQSLNWDLSLDNPARDPDFPGGLINSILFSKRLKYNSLPSAPTVLEDATKVLVFSMPVTQYADLNTNIEDGSKVVLGLKLLMQNLSITTLVAFQAVNGLNPVRHLNEGVKIVMRARLRDNTFVHDSSWGHVITKEQMGTGIIGDGRQSQLTLGKLFIDNLPGDVAGENFTPGVNTPDTNYEWDVDLKYNSVAEMLTSFNQPISGNPFWRGARILVSSPPSIYEVVQETSSPFDLSISEVQNPIAEGEQIRARFYTTVSGEGEMMMYKVVGGVIDNITSSGRSTLFQEESTLSGQDLFDLSPLFVGPTQLWPSVTALEFELVGQDISNYTNSLPLLAQSGASPYISRFVDHNVKLVEGPYLYKVAPEFQVQDRPMFSAIEGKVVKTTNPDVVQGFPTTPEGIVQDIMDTMFPNKTPSDKLHSFMSLSQRSSWAWRRQFIKSHNAKKVMEELMHNLWAVLTLNEDDDFEFVSLNEEDHAITSPNQVFDDSSILKDSITNPKFRKTDEIYQRFELNHDFYQVSEFSSSVPKWRKATLMAASESSSADQQLKWFMTSSNRLFNTLNIYTQGYAYHYQDAELPMKDWIVKHFVFNAWTIKLKGSIDRILGSDGLKIMDYVSINSFFHTDKQTSHGFITKIDTDVYTATCTFTIFIPRPLGYLGPLCDPFNDAWQTARNSSNFPVNDAGDAGRTTGSYTQKNAGTTPRGDIEC